MFVDGADRLIMRVLLLLLVVGFSKELASPSVLPRSADIPFIVGMSLLGWIMFRAAFRTRLVAAAHSFEVVNFLTTDSIPYQEVEEIQLDWLSIWFTLAGGRRVRVWGLPESFLSARGERGSALVQRLSVIAERRKNLPGKATSYVRRRSADWWALAVLLTIFVAASYLGA